MSATTAIHSVACPVTARARNATFSPTANATFALMIDSARRLRRMANGTFEQFVGHQRDVGGLERGVAAGHPHRDADVRGGQRRRVVDAVADHRDRTVAFARRSSMARTLSSGSSSARTSSTPTAAATLRAVGLVVAGQHHDVPHAVGAQLGDRLAHVRAHLVGHARAAPTASPSSASITGVCPRPDRASR